MTHKSLYIFLSALLGALLFLILHRLVVFVILYLIAIGSLTTDVSYRDFVTVEYFSLIISLMLGAWYGIWLGLSWFNMIYEEQTHPGFVGNLRDRLFVDHSHKLESMLIEAKERLQEDAEQVTELATQVAEEGHVGETIVIEETVVTPTIIAVPTQSTSKKKKSVSRKSAKKKAASQI